MVILEGEKAIEYLQRARSCIHPDDKISHLPMISHMLAIEEGYIRMCMQDDSTRSLAKVCIDGSGFPELASWWADISSALKEYDATCQKRAKAVLPLLRNLSNLMLGGCAPEKMGLEKILASDYFLTKGIESLTQEERLFLRSFPISERSQKSRMTTGNVNAWGALFIEDMYCTPFHKGYLIHKENNGVGDSVFKYIDSTSDTRPPAIVYINMGFQDLPSDRVKYFKLLTPGRSLIGGASGAWVKCNEEYGDMYEPAGCYSRHAHIGGVWAEHYILNLSTAPFFEGSEYCEVLKNLEGLCGHSLEILYRADIAGLTDPDQDCFLNTLVKFDKLLKDINALLDGRVLKGRAVLSEDYVSGLNDAAGALRQIFCALPNDGFREDFQLALGGYSSDAQEKAQGIAQGATEMASATYLPGNSAGSAKPLKRGFWKWLPRLPKLKAQMIDGSGAH